MPRSSALPLVGAWLANPVRRTASRSTGSALVSSGSTWPVAVVSPGFIAFFARSVTGSMPSASAMRSMCTSTANCVCGAPNPRNAPFGGVFVRIALPADAHVRARVRARSREARRATARPGSACSTRRRRA